MEKALNQSISTFYGLHHEKGKSYTFEHFKKAAHKSRIYRIMKYFDERGHCNRQASSIWQFEGKNSQSRWIWIEKPQLIHRYVICTILKYILVRKLKYSRKYNSSPIFFGSYFTCFAGTSKQKISHSYLGASLGVGPVSVGANGACLLDRPSLWI